MPDILFWYFSDSYNCYILRFDQLDTPDPDCVFNLKGYFIAEATLDGINWYYSEIFTVNTYAVGVTTCPISCVFVEIDESYTLDIF